VTAPPGLRLCATDELSVAFVLGGAATGTSFTDYGINNNSDSPCALPGPPGLRFEDAGGADLAISYGSNRPCSPDTVPNCVVNGSLALEPTLLTPIVLGPAPGATVTVTTSTVRLLLPCESPNVFAYTLVIAFPEVGELQVPLEPLEFNQCFLDAGLFAFR